MRFSQVVDLYMSEQKADGRINSPRTEREYRSVLNHHADDVGNRDPRLTGRDDVKRTLARWPHPNTRSKGRSILVSFYVWAVEYGLRETNPAAQVKRPKRRAPQLYRLTREETAALYKAASSSRERRCIHIGLCAGLRRQELIGLQGRHFRRDGWIWVSADIAKGGKERWVPVLPELEPVYRDCRKLEDDDHVLPAQRFRDPGINKQRRDYLKHPCSEQAVWRLVRTVGKRAGIPAPVHPHLLRHAYADRMVRAVGIEVARALLGHKNFKTTQGYLSEPSLDDIAEAIGGLSLDRQASKPGEAPTGIEPVEGLSRTLERLFGSTLLRDAARSMS